MGGLPVPTLTMGGLQALMRARPSEWMVGLPSLECRIQGWRKVAWWSGGHPLAFGSGVQGGSTGGGAAAVAIARPLSLGPRRNMAGSHVL